MHLITIFFLIIFSNILPNHPFHVSVCEISHNERTGSLEIIHKLFADDFEEALQKAYGMSYDSLMTTNEAKEKIKAYFESRFSIAIDGKVAQPVFVGFELESDAIWFYFEVPGVKKLKEVKVENRLLMEIFPDQSNIVHIMYKGNQKSMRLVKGNAVEKVSFDK